MDNGPNKIRAVEEKGTASDGSNEPQSNELAELGGHDGLVEEDKSMVEPGEP